MIHYFIISLSNIINSDFCDGLKKGCKPMDRHTLTSKLPVIQSLVVEILKIMLVGFFIALTCDHWTSPANTAYLSVTAHFINEDWKYVSLILCCTEHKGKTTSVDCDRELKKVIEKYDIKIEKVVALVTDTENTMTSLGKVSKLLHIYCFAHLLELVTVRSFEIEG